MKKTKCCFLIGLIFISTSLFGQLVPAPSWGVKGGINLANIGGEETDNAMKVAVNLGLYGQKNFNSFWHMKLELLYSTQGHGAKTDSDNKLNTSYLNLPIVVEYDPSFNYGFHAGFQPGLLLSAKSKFGDTSTDVKDFFTTADLAFILGGSYYLMDKKVHITLRYIHGFTNIASDELVPDPPTRFNRVIQISAGYMIARIFGE